MGRKNIAARLCEVWRQAGSKFKRAVYIEVMTEDRRQKLGGGV